MEDVLGEVGLDQRVGVEPVAVLGRDQDAHDLDRADVPVLVGLVADRHLRLAVGPQVREHVGLAHLGEPAADRCASVIGSGISSSVSSVA